MPANTQFTDGTTYSFNSVTLAITNAASATYTTQMTIVAENVTITRPSDVIEVRDQLNRPSGAQVTLGFATGAATCQLLSSHDIEVGATFTKDFGLGSETWGVTSVDKAYSQGDAVKQNISFRKTITGFTASA